MFTYLLAHPFRGCPECQSLRLHLLHMLLAFLVGCLRHSRRFSRTYGLVISLSVLRHIQQFARYAIREFYRQNGERRVRPPERVRAEGTRLTGPPRTRSRTLGALVLAHNQALAQRRGRGLGLDLDLTNAPRQYLAQVNVPGPGHGREARSARLRAYMSLINRRTRGRTRTCRRGRNRV